MCDCIPSSPLTYHRLKTPNLPPNSNLFRKRTPTNPSNLSHSHRLRSQIKVSSDNIAPFDELKFSDKPQSGFDQESSPEGGFGVSDGEDEANRSSKATSGFDILELKSEVGDVKVVKKSWGSQVIRRSNMIAKQVISVQTALSLGFVSQLWVNTTSWVIHVVEVRPSLLSGEVERFLLNDVCQVGDVVLVQDESTMENEFKMIGLDTLVGYTVMTPSRRNIGKVRGYTFNINSGILELLELDSFGVSIIPSSLVTTYALFVEDVIEVASDTVIVHDVAASRLQRLTRGFFDAGNVEPEKDEPKEYSNRGRPARRRSSSKDRKFPQNRKESEDNLDLPMDYL